VELLAPAGDEQCLKAAVNAGADAIYIGGERFGARAYAENFDTRAVCDAIDYVHLFGKKLYLTLNTLLKDVELSEVPAYVMPFYEAGLDGVIVQDFGVVNVLRKYFADMEIHASTQMTVTGADGAKLLKSMGISRVVPARELSLAEIARIRQEAEIEVETFIHGAMCYCYSGQCLFSSFLGGRSGNRGRCAGPCRLPYDLVGSEGRINNKSEQYPLSLKDMGTLGILPKLMESGIDSFKIEGRMKSPEYVAGVTSIYRKYIDEYTKDRERFRIDARDMECLQNLYTRGDMETGYYDRHSGRDMVTLLGSSYENADSDFSREIKEKYVDAPVKIPLFGKAVLHVGMPVTFSLSAFGSGDPDVSAGDGDKSPREQVSLTSDMEVMAAQNRPMEEEDIRKQLSKMGNTPFVLGHLQIEKDEQIFIPNKELNELRRRGVEQMKSKLLAPYRRCLQRNAENAVADGYGYSQRIHIERSSGMDYNQYNQTMVSPSGSEAFTISVTNKEQLAAAIETAGEVLPDRIYLPYRLYEDMAQDDDCLLRAVSDLGISCYLSFPAIVRHKEKMEIAHFLEMCEQHFDQVEGFLVNSLECLAFLKGLKKDDIAGKRFQSDYGLYCFNSGAHSLLREMGIEEMTAPFEWSRHEWKAFIQTHSSPIPEIILYGHIPLMESANCIYKTMNRCKKKNREADWGLEDRYKKLFPVLTDCDSCGNTILNSVPLSLHKEWDTIKQLGISRYRLRFTIEYKAQTRSLIRQFGHLLETGIMRDPPKDYTTGHFRKGVL